MESQGLLIIHICSLPLCALVRTQRALVSCQASTTAVPGSPLGRPTWRWLQPRAAVWLLQGGLACAPVRGRGWASVGPPSHLRSTSASGICSSPALCGGSPQDPPSSVLLQRSLEARIQGIRRAGACDVPMAVWTAGSGRDSPTRAPTPTCRRPSGEPDCGPGAYRDWEVLPSLEGCDPL